MKKVKEVFVIFNPYDNGYYDGYGYFRGILFSKKYAEKEMAVSEMEKILDRSMLTCRELINSRSFEVEMS